MEATPQENPKLVALVEKTRREGADRLLKLRRRRKLSQAQVAKQSGLSISYVSMLERGLRDPSIESRCALALVYRCKPSDI